jgi:hypothetical protein
MQNTQLMQSTQNTHQPIPYQNSQIEAWSRARLAAGVRVKRGDIGTVYQYILNQFWPNSVPKRLGRLKKNIMKTHDILARPEAPVS